MAFMMDVSTCQVVGSTGANGFNENIAMQLSNAYTDLSSNLGRCSSNLFSAVQNINGSTALAFSDVREVAAPNTAMAKSHEINKGKE